MSIFLELFLNSLRESLANAASGVFRARYSMQTLIISFSTYLE